MQQPKTRDTTNQLRNTFANRLPETLDVWSVYAVQEVTASTRITEVAPMDFQVVIDPPQYGEVNYIEIEGAGQQAAAKAMQAVSHLKHKKITLVSFEIYYIGEETPEELPVMIPKKSRY